MIKSTTPAGRLRRVADAHRAALRTCLHASDLPHAATHPDTGLLESCVAYGRVRLRIDRLFHGHHRIMDETERSRAHAALDDAAAAPLAMVASLRATTLDGHRARAAAFLLLDDGDLLGRAGRVGLPEDRLLAALLLDLIGPL